MANCPNEPAALESPSAMLRRSGGKTRLTTPKTLLKVVQPCASPMKRPVARLNCQPVVDIAISTRPVSAMRSSSQRFLRLANPREGEQDVSAVWRRGASWGQPAETLKVMAGLARRGALIAGPYRIKEPSSAHDAAGASLATFAATTSRLPSSLTLVTKPL